MSRTVPSLHYYFFFNTTSAELIYIPLNSLIPLLCHCSIRRRELLAKRPRNRCRVLLTLGGVCEHLLWRAACQDQPLSVWCVVYIVLKYNKSLIGSLFRILYDFFGRMRSCMRMMLVIVFVVWIVVVVIS